jgi:hypothetical protein
MENLYSLKIKTRDKEYMMGIRFCFIVLIAFAAGASGQTVKSSIEFFDTITNKKMGEIGSSGSASGSTFFIEENGTKRVVISKDTVSVDGHIKATSFTGNGSKLTGVTVDSISWDKIKNMPAGFADGVDNSGAASVDSVKRCAISDSSKTTGSVNWKNIKDIPAGFADGVDNSGSGTAADSARVAMYADSAKKVADGSITAAKFAPSLKIQADSSRAAFLADSVKKIPKNIKVDSAKVAESIMSSAIIAGSQVNPAFGNSYVSTGSGYKLLNNSTNGLDVRFSIESDWLYISKYYNSTWNAMQAFYLSEAKPLIRFFGNADIIDNTGSSISIGMNPGNLGLITLTHNGTDAKISSNKGRIVLEPTTGSPVFVNGELSCLSNCGTSDVRYKENISDLSDALTKVLSLRSVYFGWNHDVLPNAPVGRQLGFIAQDVENVIPEIVKTDASGFKAIEYDKMTAMLTKAIQEQQEIIEKQNKEIEELKLLINQVLQR